MAAGTDAAAGTGVAVALPWAIVEVRGDDAAEYLHGQLSQDVAALDEGASRWTFLLQPTGKVDAWLRLTRLGPHRFWLDAPLADPAPVVDRLRRFALRTRVEVDAVDRVVRSYRGDGARGGAARGAPDGAVVLDGGWPATEGADVVLPEGVDPQPEQQGDPEGRERWEAMRISDGIPRNGSDIGTGTIPAEAGAWVVEQSVSFTKGCFTGQELVARVDSRGGNVPRPLRVLEVDGATAPPPGAEIVVEGSVAGAVTSSAAPAGSAGPRGPVALGPVARRVEPGSQVELRWPGGTATATVRTPPLR